MNFLELCQEVRRECALPGSGPTSVKNQQGILENIIHWTNQAYEAIQLESSEWYFRQAEKTFQTIENVTSYTSEMLDVSNITQGTVSIYLDSVADEALLTVLPYQDFRENFLVGEQTASRPYYYSVKNKKDFVISKPDDVYTIRFEYTKKAERLVDNTDIPMIPSEYHEAIIYKACMYYSGYEEAGEQYQAFYVRYNEIFNRLVREQRDNIIVAAGSLA